LPFDEVSQEIAPRIAFDVGDVGPGNGGFRLARYRRHGGKASTHIAAGLEPENSRKSSSGETRMRPLTPTPLLGLQFANDLRAADAAIAFADDKIWVIANRSYFSSQRRIVAAIELTSAVDRKESLVNVLPAGDEAAIAGADRIDEDEISKVEPGFGIGLEVGRSGRNRRICIDGQPPGSGISKLQIGRGLRPGPR